MEISIVLGQGIAGSTLAWSLHWAGDDVHVLNSGQPETASGIAAGLITPITGRRLVKAVEFDTCRMIAETFYKKVEAIVGRPILDLTPSVRTFKKDEERTFFLQERVHQYGDDIELVSNADGRVVGFRMLKAARLRVPDYLSATRDYFQQQGRYHQQHVNVSTDIQLLTEGVKVTSAGLTGTRIIFCQGYQAEPNPWFPNIPDAPVRGEIMKVRIPSRKQASVEHRGYWLAPYQPQASAQDSNTDEYLIGATYDRVNLKGPVDDSGQKELMKGLTQLTSEEFTVTGHYSAVRAGTSNRQPIVAIHSQHRQLAILNGMGSRASLLAPAAAVAMIEKLKNQNGEENQNAEETGRKKAVSLTHLAHSIMRRAIQAGDTVIDATAGNGYDTIFLASCVTETGRVLAIDVQQAAIEATKDRLQAANVQHMTLLAEDHAQVLQRLKEQSLQVRAIMFNLGYLPGSDKQHTTNADTTTSAILCGLKLLTSGGVMTVTAYRGHPGGQEEAAAVERIAKQQTPPHISVDIIPGSVDNQESPILYVFRSRDTNDR